MAELVDAYVSEAYGATHGSSILPVPTMEKPNIIVILGPTATGKSDLAVSIAKKVGGEVISADSRQVYTGLDLGTGKITKKEKRGVPHHMLDVADPKREYSVARYTKEAKKIIKDILKRGKTPIICGGTGLYIDALVFNHTFPEVKPNKALRKILEKEPIETLVKRLRALDPQRLETIDQKNPVRLIRAIEIAETLGKVPALSPADSPYDVTWIGLDTDTEILKERIEIRLKKRMKAGMLKEAEKLHTEGLSWKRMDALGLEYRYLAQLLKKEITREQFEQELALKILQYAKRQRTWFKRNKKIQWIDPKDILAIKNLLSNI